MLTSEPLTKIEEMDKYLNSFGKQVASSDICKALDFIFGIHLEEVPVLDKTFLETTPKAAIDMYMYQYEQEMTCIEIRTMLNQIFGINLVGIDTLGRQRISLFTKGQWFVQNEKDLFIIHTGVNDVDVKILPTAYFKRQTGLSVLPEDLQHSLSSLGFYYDDKIQDFYFLNPNNESVQDQFKGQTIGAIVEVIQKDYSHL
ncbi:hypothetical protein [Psychrobacillus sp. L3]|uniref:hypothetical protein n=1 Tax=Psychrobacillus sp. L3 TaxID=3236891 RepID=UPI0036F387EE